MASLWTGFFVQAGLVILDLAKTPPMAPAYLESLHPALMGHGVIIAMLTSGTVFAAVSLVTRPSAEHHLAPFFKKTARGAGTSKVYRCFSTED